MLRCNECKLQIHYECTRLPAYQLHQFKTKGYRKYICESCTVDIPNEIKELCDNVAASCVTSHWSENKSSEDLQIYLKEIKNLEEENRTMKKKIEERDKRQEVLRKVIKDQETTFKMKNEIANRRESQRDTNECEIAAKEKCILESIDKLLDKKLECVAERLGKSILNELKENSRSIDMKLKEVISENKSYAQSVKGPLADKDNKPNGVADFKSILNDAKNDQLLEEKDRAGRSKNLIIYGLEEKGNDKDEIKINDGQMTRLFLKKIDVLATPLNIYRLGRPEPDKIRPLKLEMVSSIERDLVMKNLNQLKGTEEELGKLNVKEDYTKEREQIRNFVDIAKAKNREENDPSHYWVIRGTPKNGIRLVKLTRR